MKKLLTALGVMIWCMLQAQQINRVEYFINTDPGFGNATALPITAGDSVSGIFSVPTNSLAPGVHVIYVRALDASNQWSVFSKKTIHIQTPPPVQIVAAEYFIGTDPGIGNGTPITVTAGDSVDLVFAVPTASLPTGTHEIYARAKDALGHWSVFSKKTFFVQTPNPVSIVAAEYFVDTDPGFGNATALSVTPGDSVEINFDVSTTGLSEGLHFVHVRTQTSDGKWSVYSKKYFYIYPQAAGEVIAAEYFVDTDPGFGNGTSLSVSPNDSIQSNFDIATGALSHGFHQIYVRTLDSKGKWSVYSRKQIYVYPEPKSIVFAEYHIDNLGAYGTGTSLNITPGDSVQQNFQVPTNLLTLGWHKIYVTVKDAADNWSVFSKDSFLVDAFNCPIYNNGEIALVGDTCKGSQITFNDLVTYNTSENTNDYTREWDFFDDGTVDFSGESVNYTFNQTGTFTVKLRTYLTSSPLCSETVYKTFTIRNVDTTNLNVSICDGQSHFAGGGNQTVQGIYYDVKPNRWGCDSVIITNLTVIPNVTPSVSIVASQTSFCSGSYVQFDATPTNGGTNPYYQWKVNGTIVSQGYGWQGYTSYGTYGLADDDIVTVELTSNETCTTVNPAVSNGIQVSVTPSVSASITISVDNNDFCAGTTATFSVTNTNNPGNNPQYAWYINNILQVETGTTLSRSNFSGGEQVRCYLTSDATCVNNSPVSSNIITMTVYPNGAPDVSISRNNNNICFGTQVVFTAANAYGGSNPNYQWFLNGVSIQNGASNQYISTTLDDEDSIAVVLTSDYQCRTATYDTSNSFIMDVFYSTPTTVSLSANDNDICDGQTVSFTATPSPFYGGETYTWYRNHQVVQSGTSRFFTSTSLANKDSVWVVLDATPLPCATGIPAKSDTIHFTVTPNVTAGISIVESVNNICAGTNVSFTATPTNPGNNPTYAWYVNNNYQPGFTNNTFASTGLSNGSTVTAYLTSSIECALNNPAQSNGIVMNVTSVLLPEVSITTPITTICEGTEVSFTATVSNEGNNPTIEWLVNNSVVQTGGLTFTSEDLENLNNIRVRLTSDYACPQTNPVLSNQIQMTVYDSVTPTVFLSYGPNPACVGNLITLFATPSFPGSNPTYTFYKNGNVVQSGSQTQYTSSNFNDGDEVYVVLESDANCARTTTATSNTEAISIVQFAQATVSIQATTAQCVGSSITFTATGQNAGSNPIYTWKVNNAIFQSSGSNIFNTNAVNNGDVVVCEMNSSLGCVSNNPAVSNSITVQFSSVVTPSVDLTASVNNVCQGTNITFTAAPTNGGSTPNYIFRRNSNIVQNSTSNVYATANLLNNDVISVEMTSSEGCVSVNPVSDNVTVILNQCSQANVVLSAASSVCEGDDITLTATPTNGGQTPSYEFFVDGNSVYSGASNQYVIQNAQDGSYSAYVVLTSSETNVTNNPATSNTVQVTVNNIVVPTVSIAPSMNNVCQSEYIVFTASTGNAGNNPSYAWYINGNFVQQNNQPELGGYFGTNDTITLVLTSNAVCAQPSQVAAGFRLNLIQAVTPSVDLVASINNTCQGTSITFTATPTNGGSNPTYIFRRNNAVVQSGNDNTFTTAALQHNDVISVELSSNASCVTSTTASDAVTVLFTQCQQVEVGLSVSSSSVCVGDDITLTAFPTNGGQTPSYEFFVNGFSVYSGSQNQFTINAAQAGVYSAYVVLTSSETNVTNNPATSNIVQVTVNNIVVPTVTVFASANNVCENQYITLTTNVTNGGNNPGYAWYINGGFVQFNNQPELGGYFSNNDTVTVVVTSNAVCAQPNSVATGFRFSLIPDVTPSVSTTADNNNFCYGTAATFTATPTNGGSNPEYAWYVDGALMQTGSSNTFTSSVLENGDDVYVVITSSETCVTSSTASSNAIAMNVTYYQTPSVSIINNYGNAVCLNDVVTYTASSSNGGTNPTYEWFVNGFSVQNSNSNELTVPAAQVGQYEVYVILTSTYPCLQTATATSSTANLTVSTALTPDISIVSNTTEICPGGTVVFEVWSTTNGGLTPSYQWLVNNDPVSGAQGTTFSPNNLQDGDVVSCEFTSSFRCAVNNPDTSNTIKIIVAQNAIASVSISVNNNSYCEGSSSVTFFANAINDGNAPDYEWYLNGNLAASGVNASSYTLNSPADEDSVYVYMVSNDACVASVNQAVYSNGIELEELPTVAVSASIVATVNNVCPGEAVSFTTTAVNGGNNTTYVWNVNGQDVQFNNNETYTAILNDGDEVYVKVFSSETCPSDYPAISNTVEVIINSANCTNPVSVAINASANTICEGTAVTFTSNAANEGTAPNYNWYVNGTSVQNGSSSELVYTFSNDGQYTVYVVLTSSESNVSNNPATSNTQVVVVNNQVTPSASIVANSSGICAGENLSFTVSTTHAGVSPTFDWYVNGNLVQSSLANTFSSTNFVDGDEVYVVLNSTASCVTAATATSNIIEVQVNQLTPPTVQVVANPAVAVCPNTSVTYSTTSVNSGNNPTFEWYVNGTFVSNNTTYQFTPNDDDSVSVIMTSNSLCASVPTAVNHVNMTVGLILQAGVSITSVNAGVVCENTTKTFTATPVNGGSNPQYQWQVNGSTVSTAGASFTATNLVAGDEVSVILTSNNTCVSNTVATSNVINISVLPYLEPDVLISATAYDVCEGATVTYTASPVNGGNNPAYAWYVDGVLVSNIIVYSYAPQQGDTVSVVMTTSYECPTEPTSSNNIFPTIYPEPVASFTADIDTSTMVEFFNQVDSNTTYIWFFGDGATASYLSNPIHVYSSGNYYTVTLVAINPCGSDTMTQVITVEPIPTNIVESDILFESVKLYPNPAERFVNINLELVQSAELQLTWHDALSRIVYAENMAAVKGSNTQRFDMSNFAKGVYTLSIRNEQYSITKRLVLQ